MLTTIENKLEELFESIEVMPPELVAEAEKMKEKERRMRLREEKLAAQRAHQEERVRKALERAKAEPKKKVSTAWLHLCVSHFRKSQPICVHCYSYFRNNLAAIFLLAVASC